MTDDLLSSLGTIAHGVSKAKKKDRASRFWFKMETAAQAVSESKEKLKPPPAEHVDQEVVERTKQYNEELPIALKQKIELVREFFLVEIAPITFAAGGGAGQAREVAQRTLDIEIDGALFARFENMVNRAATLKLSKFVATLFDLPEDAASSLIGTPPASSSDTLLKSVVADMQALSSRETKKELTAMKSGLSKIEKALDATKR